MYLDTDIDSQKIDLVSWFYLKAPKIAIIYHFLPFTLPPIPLRTLLPPVPTWSQSSWRIFLLFYISLLGIWLGEAPYRILSRNTNWPQEMKGWKMIYQVEQNYLESNEKWIPLVTYIPTGLKTLEALVSITRLERLKCWEAVFTVRI